MATLTTYIDGVMELSSGVRRTPLSFPLVREDEKAHTFRVACMNNGSSVYLDDDAVVTGRFARADGLVVPLTGSVEGGVAVVTLTSACYRVSGAFALVIKATYDGVTSSIYLADGNVFSAGGDALVDSGETALSLEELFNRLEAAKASTAASAEIAAQAAQDAQVALGGAEAVARAEAAAAAAEAALTRLEGLDVAALVAELDALKAGTRPTLLWESGDSGAWNSGSITVNGFHEWHVIDIETSFGHALAVNTGASMNVNLVARYGTTLDHHTVVMVIAVDSDTLTMTTSLRLRHQNQDQHTTLDSTASVRSITGIMKKGVYM